MSGQTDYVGPYITGTTNSPDLNTADYASSLNAINQQANAIVAAGGSTSEAQQLAYSAMQNLGQMGSASAYFTPAGTSTTTTPAGTSPTALPLWQKALLALTPSAMALAPAPLLAIGPAANTLADFKNWSVSRIAVLAVGIVMLLGSVVMFASDKTNVTEIVSTITKNPELVA